MLIQFLYWLFSDKSTKTGAVLNLCNDEIFDHARIARCDLSLVNCANESEAVVSFSEICKTEFLETWRGIVDDVFEHSWRRIADIERGQSWQLLQHLNKERVVDQDQSQVGNVFVHAEVAEIVKRIVVGRRRRKC